MKRLPHTISIYKNMLFPDRFLSFLLFDRITFLKFVYRLNREHSVFIYNMFQKEIIRVIRNLPEFKNNLAIIKAIQYAYSL